MKFTLKQLALYRLSALFKADRTFLEIRLTKTNLPTQIADILIAATALANDLKLATLNKNHFERIQGVILIERK